MATASVSVTFEADDLETAQTLIESWTLHAGCSVSATLLAAIPPGPAVTDAAGRVVEAPPPAAE